MCFDLEIRRLNCSRNRTADVEIIVPKSHAVPDLLVEGKAIVPSVEPPTIALQVVPEEEKKKPSHLLSKSHRRSRSVDLRDIPQGTQTILLTRSAPPTSPRVTKLDSVHKSTPPKLSPIESLDWAVQLDDASYSSSSTSPSGSPPNSTSLITKAKSPIGKVSKCFPFHLKSCHLVASGNFKCKDHWMKCFPFHLKSCHLVATLQMERKTFHPMIFCWVHRYGKESRIVFPVYCRWTPPKRRKKHHENVNSPSVRATHHTNRLLKCWKRLKSFYSSTTYPLPLFIAYSCIYHTRCTPITSFAAKSKNQKRSPSTWKFVQCLGFPILFLCTRIESQAMSGGTKILWTSCWVKWNSKKYRPLVSILLVVVFEEVISKRSKAWVDGNSIPLLVLSVW